MAELGFGMAAQSPPAVERLFIHDGQDEPLTVDAVLARDTVPSSTLIHDRTP